MMMLVCVYACVCAPALDRFLNNDKDDDEEKKDEKVGDTDARLIPTYTYTHAHTHTHAHTTATR